jgi:hypothetical protein
MHVHYDPKIKNKVNTIKNDTTRHRSLEKVKDLNLPTFNSNALASHHFAQITLDLQAILKNMHRKKQFHVVDIGKNL